MYTGTLATPNTGHAYTACLVTDHQLCATQLSCCTIQGDERCLWLELFDYYLFANYVVIIKCPERLP